MCLVCVRHSFSCPSTKARSSLRSSSRCVSVSIPAAMRLRFSSGFMLTTGRHLNFCSSISTPKTSHSLSALILLSRSASSDAITFMTPSRPSARASRVPTLIFTCCSAPRSATSTTMARASLRLFSAPASREAQARTPLTGAGAGEVNFSDSVILMSCAVGAGLPGPHIPAQS